MGSPVEGCPEAVGFHGSPTAQGRCPWCGVRLRGETGQTRSRPALLWEPSELTDSYALYFDPDYGALSRDDVRDRYRMGQDP